MRRKPVRKEIKVREEPTLRKGDAKLSKRVEHRMKATHELLKVIGELRAEVAKGFRLNFEAELRDGEVMPDQGLSLVLAGRWVKTAFDALEDADQRYCKQGSKRRILDQGIVHLARHRIYPELRDVRREIEWRYGKKEGSHFHRMRGRTRRKPQRQLPQLQHLVTALEGEPPKVEPIRPLAPGEHRKWLAQLKPLHTLLQDKLDELQEMASAEVRLRNDRDYELESFDVVYARALALAESLLQVSGLSERAIRALLPTILRRRRSAKARRERDAREDGKRPAKGEEADDASAEDGEIAQ